MEYTFTMPEAGEVYFDSLLSDSRATWSLHDTQGRRIAGDEFDDDTGGLSRQWLNAGTYRLLVQRTDDQVTELPFRLLRFAELPQITPGAPVRTVLDPGSVTQGFRFEGEAGQRLKVALGQAGSGAAAWRMIGPDGQEVFAGTSITDIDAVQLHQTGTYVLLLEGRIGFDAPLALSLNLIDTPRRTPGCWIS